MLPFFSAYKEKLERAFRATVGTNLAFVRLFLGLLERLEGKAIPVIALKGPVAAYAHHGNLAARQFGDLDLLFGATARLSLPAWRSFRGAIDLFGGARSLKLDQKREVRPAAGASLVLLYGY